MRRRFFGATVVGIVAAVTLALGATASGTTSSSTRLFAYVVQPSQGPLHRGDILVNHIYVLNANRPTNSLGNRMTLPNAFVVDDVNVRIFVDGAEWLNFTATPPPNVEFAPWAGRWVSTVTCAPGTPPPCAQIGKPAVIPGENTVVFFPGYTHSEGEPNGTYVFRYTMHGTVNGNPVALTASSAPIEMVD